MGVYVREMVMDLARYQPRVAVLADPGDDSAVRGVADALAATLGLERVNLRQSVAFDVLLGVTASGLDLRVVREAAGRLPEAFRTIAGGRPVRVDLASLDTTSGPGRRLNQPLFKAVGIRKGDPYRPRVADLTAGYGGDAYLLAMAGCEVVACERHPVVRAVLEDAVRRVKVGAGVAIRVMPPMFSSEAQRSAPGGERATAAEDAPDSEKTLRCASRLNDPAEVMYLDPMFPGAADRRAAEKKPMRLLRLLVGEDEDAGELFERAMAARPRRVVVKRPHGAPPLGPDPVTSHAGKAVRWDVYVP